MKVTSAQLDRLVSIEYNDSTQDASYGTEVPNWRPLVPAPGSPEVSEEMWAQILDVAPGRAESVVGGLQVSKNQTRIRMRWRDDVDSSMRIREVVSGTIYQIIGGPAEVAGSRRRWMEFLTERYSVTQ